MAMKNRTHAGEAGSRMDSIKVRGLGEVGPRIDAALRQYGIDASPRSIVDVFEEALHHVVRGRSVAAPPQLSPGDAEELRSAGLNIDRSAGAYSRAASATTAKMAAVLSDALTVAEVAERLGRTTSRVRQMLNSPEPSLYGIKLSDGDWRIPCFQLVDDQPPANLPAVLRALPRDVHPIEFYNWFTAPDPALQVEGEALSPRDWLASGGNPAPVAAEAAQL